MQKCLIATFTGLLAMAASSAFAQTTFAGGGYAVKFVCGTQSPERSLTAPAEPPVKPGNYATVINVEALATDPNSGTDSVTEVISPAGVVPTATNTLTFSAAFLTQDITCADIVAASGASGPGIITGYVNLIPAFPISVTAVYTTQGCTFPILPATVATRPVCNGPTDIDVVPQQRIFSSNPS